MRVVAGERRCEQQPVAMRLGQTPRFGPERGWAVLEAPAGASALRVLGRYGLNDDPVAPPGSDWWDLCTDHGLVQMTATGRFSIERSGHVTIGCFARGKGSAFTIANLRSGSAIQQLGSSSRSLPLATVRLQYRPLTLSWSGDGISPDGNSVLLAINVAKIIGRTTEMELWTPAKHRVKVLHKPADLADWDLEAGAWLIPSLVLDSPLRAGSSAGSSGYFVLLNPLSGKWGRLQKLGTASDSYTVCGLPNGRALLAVSPQNDGATAIYVSNVAGTALVRVDTSGLHAAQIDSVSCPAEEAGTIYAFDEQDTHAFAIPAASIDGSPWTVAR